MIRHEGRVDLAAALTHLRTERGVRTLLCEGGPGLHAQLIEAGLVDELFVTHAPKLAGGEGPGLVTGLPELERPLELAWLLEHEGELFGRYRTVRPPSRRPARSGRQLRSSPASGSALVASRSARWRDDSSWMYAATRASIRRSDARLGARGLEACGSAFGPHSVFLLESK